VRPSGLPERGDLTYGGDKYSGSNEEDISCDFKQCEYECFEIDEGRKNYA
jgi:hypothetical protein